MTLTLLPGMTLDPEFEVLAMARLRHFYHCFPSGLPSHLGSHLEAIMVLLTLSCIESSLSWHMTQYNTQLILLRDNVGARPFA